MGASASMSTADSITQQNTYTFYAVVVLMIILVISLYNYPNTNLLFGIVAVVSLLYYISSRNWRYVLR